MNSKKLIIFEYPILFNILNEISEVLNFDLIQTDRNHLNDIEKKLTSDFLVISKDQNSVKSSHLVLKNLPLKITKLVELLNVEFLKKKFNEQSNITVSKYTINTNSREMILHNQKLRLTEKEIKMIIYLSQRKKPIKINELQEKVWGYQSKLETHTVETHIYRLRKKINS